MDSQSGAGEIAEGVLERAMTLVLEGRVESLRGMLEAHPGLVGRRLTQEAGEPRNTLLHFATGMGEVAWPESAPRVAEVLLAAGAPVDAPETASGGETPLHHAVSVNNVPVAQVLLDRGADPEAPGRHRDGLDTALGYALFYGQDRRLPRYPTNAPQLLRERGARVHVPFAAALGDLDAVQRGLAGVSAKERMRGLVFAALWGRTETVAALLAAGVPSSGLVQFFHWRVTPLHAAALHGHQETVERLLAAGIDAGVEDGAYGADAAGWAAQGGHQALAQRLQAATGE